MKLILGDNEKYVIRFDRGDEVIGELQAFCEERSIFAGSFQAIGGAGEVVLSYYNLETKEYEDVELKEKNLEVIGVSGTISVQNGKVIVHAHGTISGRDLVPKAGHIKKLLISTTSEVVLTALKGKVERKHDDATGLNLID